MGDQIIIKGLQLDCHIGVPAEERAEPQSLRVHLTLQVPPFPKSDEIEGTVDYKEVADQVRALAASGERKLIETLAQDIASHILSSFPVDRVRVELDKRILPETDWVGVIIERTN
ncbi:MAG: dihydroneopterin aldolase [Akkermansiaceae bacterium]|nr:dihydroneopterin aldolase [Akkermansiaceae bacterium]